MAKYLSMKFSNEAKDSGIVRLDYIREDLTDEDVKSAVESILGNNLLVGKNGPLNQAVEAKVVETTYKEFNIF
ncbi:DUF2922 domain-containing protein [Lagierella sp.]|uniref:DUF2922 domain-containing protein n=1 Tax=Lagierella sp. TaxID=2849657 RepID=UPI00263848F5|nr:DUF2922 domain-containing protein [Lagierella sp.]